MDAWKKEMEAILRKNGTFEAEIRGSTLQKQMFEGFNNKEADRLRGQYIRLNMFNESWIPAIKSGTYTRFQLFDLSKDPSQKKDLSKQLPDVANRLKRQLLKLSASVMADAPDWQLAAREPTEQVPISRVQPQAGKSIRGKVVNAAGKAMAGVMVSATDEERRQTTSVFSQTDGSFAVTGLRAVDYQMRARLMGQLDEWIEDVTPGMENLLIAMQPATGEELERQRPANSGFSMLKFDNKRDKLNFKMMCSYCHQIGTLGFRTPEKPVDWETMLRRMDGFGGLYRHTQKTIIKRLVDTYKDDAVAKWPKFVPPPPPTGTAAKARITTWEIGKRFESSFHDLELGPDGLVYAVNISKHRVVILDPQTGEQNSYQLPRGSYAPHSIELGNDGNMWLTLCASGQMAKFDVQSKEFTICSSAEAPARRGSYPHTLRINPKDPEGLIWYTDAGSNSCFSLHPKTLKVKEYKLLRAEQAVAAGKGESRGITPYGLDFSPVDGTIWYSKLNGNRIGRIDPKAPDGDIKEWNPPFRGPRRLHVAPDGIVWVPGFGSGVFGKFDPKTEKWTVYDLPDAENQIPYALNIDPKGFVWICGTGNDTLNRFNPKTEELVEFRLPTRVSYTREIEFDSEGNVWTSTSGPARHMERAYGSIIKLEILGDDDGRGGTRLVGYVPKPEDLTYEQPRVVNYKNSPNGKLLARIDRNGLPKGYGSGKQHQIYVDRRMSGLSPQQRNRIGRLWAEKRKADPDMPNAGQSFVRILEYVAENEKPQGKTSSIEEKTKIHRLSSNNRAAYDAFVYVNRIPEAAEEGESAKDIAGRIFGRLANQEGRILLKLPTGMNRESYLGYKTFLRYEGTAGIGNCAACHAPAEFTDLKSHVVTKGGSPKPTPSLRNLKKRKVDLRKVILDKIAASRLKRAGKADNIDDEYAAINISEKDVAGLVAFLNLLNDTSDSDFRKLILNSKLLDTSKDIE